jgi:glycosyltransferase involved in cell wall biosynthesis
MKVLIVAGVFPAMPSGDAVHALRIGQELFNKGIEVEVLTANDPAVITDLPFKVRPIMPDWTWSQLPRLVSFLRACSPDRVLLVYSPWIFGAQMIAFLPSLLKVILPGRKTVTVFENIIIGESGPLAFKARFMRILAKGLAGIKNVDYHFGTLLRDSDQVIVLSDVFRIALAKRYPDVNRKCSLIPPPPLLRVSEENNGAIRKRYREVVGLRPDEVLLAHLGYPRKAKGIDLLLHALKELSSRRRKVRFVLIGEGSVGTTQPDAYTSELQELARQLGVAHLITWTGGFSWDSEEGSRYLRAADIGAFPFAVGIQLNSSSFAAAAAHGLPLIATQGNHLEEQFIHQKNVFLCPPNDHRALALAIETVIDQPELRAQLGQGALELARQWFSWETATSRMIAALT